MMEQIFFTSDLHFGHKNILKYENRPFADLEEHDEALIENWNSVVGKDDTVYLLGDLALCKPERALEKVVRLNGHKHWILGNHDNEKLVQQCQDAFKSVSRLLDIKVQLGGSHQDIVLCHYAMRVWNCSHRGSWHLYGHSHGKLEPFGKSMDVGVDCHGYKPISLQEVAELLAP